MNFFRRLFGKPQKQEIVTQTTQEEYEIEYELKQHGLEGILGKMSSTVGHAIIPFDIGGAVDMYYFLTHIDGTGFATMELLDINGNGPKPNELGTFELVAFTKEPYHSSEVTDTLFDLIERRICGIFTTIGKYSFQAVLKPGDTCELPGEDKENKYVIFDNYKPGEIGFIVGNRKHHLLLCMEIFKVEMEFSRANGSERLFELLKKNGYYPYSDLDRRPVI